MRLTGTGCWGCEYNWYDGICKKDGVCAGVEPFPTYISTSTSPPQTISPKMPEEIEINGVKYRRVEEND